MPGGPQLKPRVKGKPIHLITKKTQNAKIKIKTIDGVLDWIGYQAKTKWFKSIR